MKYILAALMLLSFPLTPHAAAIEKLKTFIAATHSAQANFSQDVFDQAGKRIQRASGIMQFQRPGKFRWTYQKPYEQLIVGDGSRLWVYDKDLNQVSVRKLDQALGDSPAALLAGSNEIEKIYNLTNLGNQEGLDWVEAVPKSKDNAFERIRLGFSSSGLQAMELRDQFAQVTVIKFAAVERNPKLSPELFRFVPPKGADVIRE